MKKRIYRLISLVLSGMICFSAVSMPVMADEYQNDNVLNDEGDSLLWENLSDDSVFTQDEDETELLKSRNAASLKGSKTLVVAASDFEGSIRKNDKQKKAPVSGALLAMNRGGLDHPDQYLYIGDYTYDHDVSSDETASGIALLKEAVTDVYPNESDEKMIFVQGDHESSGARSGAYEYSDYIVYVINENDYPASYSDFDAYSNTVANTAGNLKTYLNSRIQAGDGRPVLVLSHVPLHVSGNITDGAGVCGNYLFNVLNQAGAAGLNIVFVYGHAHENGADDELGGALVFLQKGDSLYVAEAEKTAQSKRTLNFTYLNAGYTGYYEAKGAADSDLTMTAFLIDDGNVNIYRYSPSGLHVLKAAGAGTDSSSLVYNSPQNIKKTNIDTSMLIGDFTENDYSYDGERQPEIGMELTAVRIDPVSVTMEPGDERSLSLILTPSSTPSYSVRWSTSDVSVAEVSNNGTLIAAAPGTAVITAESRLDSSVKAQCMVTVKDVEPTAITLDKTSAEIHTGEKIRLNADISPEKAFYWKVAYTSSDETVASVDSNGEVTGLAAGNAVITASISGKNVSASCNLTVKPITVTGIALDRKTAYLISGNTITLTATVSPDDADNKTVKWSSDNNSVASVINGTVTAHSAGTAIITAITEEGGRTDSCTVYVSNEAVYPTSFTLSYQNIVLPIDADGNLKTSVQLGIGSITPENTTERNITKFGAYWLVTIDSDGNIVSATMDNTDTVYAEMKSKSGTIRASGSIKIVKDKTDTVWKITDGTLEILSGSLNFDADSSPWRRYSNETAESVKSVIIHDGVQSIGSGTFASFTNLEDITIPSSVNSIAANAFSDCDSLSTVYAPEGSYAAGVNYGEIVQIITTEEGPEPEEEIKTITVNFDANGGNTETTSNTVTKGSVYGTLPTSEREGYEFGGWYTEKTAGTKVEATTIVTAAESHTLYAHWTAGEYTVTFDANGGSVSKTSKKITYDSVFGDLPEPVQTGYLFTGWFTAKKDGERVIADTVVTLADNITLYAHWSNEAYEVTFDANGGQVNEASRNVEYGSTYGSLPTPEREGYEFTGWYTGKTDGTKVESVTIVTTAERHTLYAHWTEMPVVEIPAVNIETGSYVEAGTEIELFSSTDGAQIHFTLDGTVPDTNSTLYTEPIIITEDTVIKAIAVKTGWISSEVFTAEFYLLQVVEYDWGEISEKDREAMNFTSPDDVPEELWVVGIEDVDYNGSAHVFENLHVYHHTRLLTPGTHYTIKYSNNVNAGTSKSKPTIVITGKGNYTGKITENFTIRPLKIGDENGNAASLSIQDASAIYNKKAQKLKTKVNYELSKERKTLSLTEKKDFVYIYSGEDDYTSEGKHIIWIEGKGNYTGTAYYAVNILPASSEYINVSSLKIDVIPAQTATGSEIRPVLTIKNKAGEILDNSHFIITYYNNVFPGTASVVLSGDPANGYTGTKKLSFKIAATSISGAEVSCIKNYTYTGSAIMQKDYRVIVNDRELTEGIDYKVSYTSNTKVGQKASIIFTGIGLYSGTLKKQFSILPLSIEELDVSPAENNTVPYMNGQIKPVVSVENNGKALKSGTDYSVVYSKTGNTFTVTGKGNYCGTIIRSFEVDQADISKCNVTVSDIFATGKAGNCKPKVVVKDPYGHVLKAGKDYEKNIKYLYSDGTEIGEKDVIPAGASLKAIIKGMGVYAGTDAEQAFRCAGKNIAGAVVKIPNQIYTGSEILLTKDDLYVKVNGIVLTSEDFDIVGYTNNINKGTAKVTIAGCGDAYAGTKTVSFKIVTKTLNYEIRYEANADGSTVSGSMKTSYTSSGAKITKNAYKRSGYAFESWNTRPDGSGASYSDGEAFRIKELFRSYGMKLTLYAQWKQL